MGETASDALKKLREALERVPTPKTPDDIRYETEERAGIQGEKEMTVHLCRNVVVSCPLVWRCKSAMPSIFTDG